MKRALLLCLVGLFVVAPARAGGPFMFVGAADDLVKQADPAFTKSRIGLAKLAGMDTLRITTIWVPGQIAVGPLESIQLENVATAAKFTGMRVIVTLMHGGSRTTPLTDEDRTQFASWAGDVATEFPQFRDFIIGNEPNLNRFWLPQFDPLDAHDVAAPAYLALLATTYDAIKLVAPRTTVYGGALAPRGVDKPNTGRDTHSPTTFIQDLGAAYRASGREVPVMDAFAFHPYADNSSQPPDFAHPSGTTIGLADYGKLVALLGQAFDGTAQRGSTLPILYDEFGVESTVPARKTSLYTGAEIAATRAVDEVTQARYYQRAVQMAFCQPTVLGILLFHFADEPELGAWQSGLYYVDGSPKSSLFPVRAALEGSRRGIVARCDGLQLTPKTVVVYPTAKQLKAKQFTVLLTCALDCAYTVRLDRPPARIAVAMRSGTAVGRKTSAIVFRRAQGLAPGRYRFTVQATATINVGPPSASGSSVLSLR